MAAARCACVCGRRSQEKILGGRGGVPVCGCERQGEDSLCVRERATQGAGRAAEKMRCAGGLLGGGLVGTEWLGSGEDSGGGGLHGGGLVSGQWVG